MQKLKKSIKRNWQIYALLIVSIVLLVSHTFYVLKTHQYPYEDEHTYLDIAVKFYDILKHPSSQSLLEISTVNPYRQPLFSLFLALPLLVVGTANTYKIALWMNYLPYVATIIAIYFLGKEFLSKKASFLASYIFAFYGFPLFYLHFTYSETFVTSLIVLSLLFLVKTNNFNNRKDVILFSIFFTLGNLSRWIVPIFVGGPLFLTLLVSVVNQIRKKERDIKNFFQNIGIFLFLGILPVLVLYYIPNFSSFSHYISGNTENASSWITKFFSPELQGLRNPYSTQSIMFYFNILSQQTIFFILLFVVGFCIAVFHFKKYAFFLLAFVVAYAVFTFGSVLKFDRYIVPIYPIMALISVVTFEHIRNKKLSFLLILMTLTIGLLNFLGASWGIGPMKFSVTGDRFTVPNSILIPMPIGHPRRVWFAPISWPPRKEELNANLAFEAIEKDFGNQSRRPIVFLTFQYNPYENAIYTILGNEKIGQFSTLLIHNSNYQQLFDYLNKTDYILIKDKMPIDKSWLNKNDKELYRYSFIMREFNTILSLTKGQLPIAFKVMKKIPLPLDKTNVIIYKRFGNTTGDQWREFANLLISSNPKSEDEIKRAEESMTSTEIK